MLIISKWGQMLLLGWGGVILITPMQTIGVYNKDALDINGIMVPGLGGHGDTGDLVLANMFGLKLEGNNFKRNRILKSAISGKELNLCLYGFD